MPYNHQKIEKKWQQRWEKEKLFQVTETRKKKKFYVLDMFPYPSAEGLHVGHLEGYTASDIVARYKKMRGYNVLHPMGWDAFGLPAENYAIKHKIHPRITTKRNIEHIKKQIRSIGLAYDWSREVNTTDPKYYRWTQWIFKKLFEHGLAYKSLAPINWCPSCKTGLANEEAVAGICERCKTETTKKEISQWMLRITAYAERLLQDLDPPAGGLDWPEAIKTMQKNWIGKSEGTEIDFRGVKQEYRNGAAKGKISAEEYTIPVFTTRADTIFGATYLVLAPEHPLVDTLVSPEYQERVKKYITKTKKKSELERTSLEKDPSTGLRAGKTGVSIGAAAINPLTGEKIPIWIADYILLHYGTGAVMAVPAHDQRDYEFAKKYGLEIREVIQPMTGSAPDDKAFIEDGKLVNSGEFSGRSSVEARKKITAWLEGKKMGKPTVQYKLQDWIFSRQRYWGEPIPLVFCEDCGWVALPDKDLPLELPAVKSYQPTGTGESPLAAIPQWVKTKCPRCNKPAKRETNTMPQWAGSCWYYLAYLIKSQKFSWNRKKIDYWMPVDLYVGGAEHAVLHLLYARFWHKFFYDLKIVGTKEPFQKLVNQGIILGPDGQKMSKSRGNVVNPDAVVREYGADVLRMYEMFMGPLEDMKPWSTQGIIGVKRFAEKIWNLAEKKNPPAGGQKIKNETLERIVHQTVKKVTEDIENLRFNTAISAMMILVNAMVKQLSIKKEHIELFVKLLAPFAPHLAEEIWEKLGNKKSIFLQKWPMYNKKLVQEEEVTIVVQINGKMRDQFTAPADISEGGAKEIAFRREKVKKYLAGKTIQRTIFIPHRLLNIVAT